jgi:uncharacterized 2Fe-2S/4Fe-4S cluster protein (DUF4445 family)
LWRWQSFTDQEIVFSLKDVSEVQMAKADVQAGVELLRERFGPEPIEEVLLAGAFGNVVDPEDARLLGLVPVSPRRGIRGVGNAAGHGACLALLDERLAREADRIARKMEYVELAGNLRFQELLADSLLFPGAIDFKEYL